MRTINKGTATLFHATGKAYSTISNKAVDAIKNPDALAIWTFLQTKDNNWTVVGGWLQKHFGIGRDRYSKAMLYLREMGLIRYEANRCKETGKLSGQRIIVNFEPVITEMPENPQVGKSTVRSTHSSENLQQPIKDYIPIKDNTNAPLPSKLDSADDTELKKTIDVEKAFEVFWNSGISKKNKKQALKSFTAYVKRHKVCPNEFAEKLAKDVKARKAAQQWGFDKMHPTTYLNNERWEDEIDLSSSSPVNASPDNDDYAMGV